MVRVAVEAGIAPEDAIVMASTHPAQWHGLRHLGAIGPGWQADLLVLPDLVGFTPELALKRGVPLTEISRPPVPDFVRQLVRIQPVDAASFSIPFTGTSLRAIGLIEDQVVTESLVAPAHVVDGHATAGGELAKIAVVERHLASGRIGKGFVAGSGSSVARSHRASRTMLTTSSSSA